MVSSFDDPHWDISARFSPIQSRGNSAAQAIVDTRGEPFTVAQDSMQIPMAQSGPRGSPETDVRNVIPDCRSAAATVKSDGTVTGRPLTIRSTVGLSACAEPDRIIVERRRL